MLGDSTVMGTLGRAEAGLHFLSASFLLSSRERLRQCSGLPWPPPRGQWQQLKQGHPCQVSAPTHPQRPAWSPQPQARPEGDHVPGRKGVNAPLGEWGLGQASEGQGLGVESGRRKELTSSRRDGYLAVRTSQEGSGKHDGGDTPRASHRVGTQRSQPWGQSERTEMGEKVL